MSEGTYTISQHAQERYAERIMQYDEKVTVVQFINNYGATKIVEDINNMIQYGQLLYTGTQSIVSKNINPNTIFDVYINGMWIIIVDKQKKNVVTLYKIDLGAGEELNKLFIDKLLEELNNKKENYNKILEINSNEIDRIKNEINENDNAINNFRKRVKMLEESNEALKESIISKNHNVELAELEVKDIIAKLIGKKTF